MKKVSIIIPAYNAAGHIGRCLDNITKQTYKNLEVIVVVDGATDNTAQVAQEYADKYPFIKVIVQPNGGTSSARNNGLNHATGEYLTFIDSDDTYAKPYSIEKMVKTMEKQNVDMVVCDFVHPVFQTWHRKGRFDLTNPEVKKDWLSDLFSHTMVWNKLYKRELITTSFTHGMYFGEDDIFNLCNLSNIKSVYCLNEVLYNYYTGPQVNNETSAIDKVVNHGEQEKPKGMFFTLIDLDKARADVVSKCLNAKDARWFRAQRYMCGFVYDVQYMKHLRLPIEAQKYCMHEELATPQFMDMLCGLEGAVYEAKTTDMTELVALVDRYVDLINASNAKDWGKMLMDVFFNIFYNKCEPVEDAVAQLYYA